MKTTRSNWILGLGIVMTIALSACNSGAPTALPTRLATQTPWIIERVITATPEPALATAIPVATNAPGKTPTRAATAKPVVPTAKPPVVPPIAAASPTTAPPACNMGTIFPIEPEPNASRNTKEVGVGGDTFRFIWNPPSTMQGASDASLGYQLTVQAKKNGATHYISHNKFWNDGKLYIMDKPAVSALAGGAATTVTWFVTVIKVTNGNFNDSDPSIPPAGWVPCGASSERRIIDLKVY